MHQKFDITLKGLLKDIPVKFLKIISGFDSGKFLDTQLTNVNILIPDLLIELTDLTILHVEIMSNPEKMLKRMFLYYALIFNHYDRLPKQILLYVGDKPLNIENKIGNYSFEIIDIKDINCSELLESDKPEDIVLAILCKSENMDFTVAKILEKLSVLPLKDREDYILKLLYLSDLRKLYTKIKQEVEKMPITINLEDSDIYKEAVEKGLSKGKLEGLFEGKREGLFEGKREGLFEGKREGLLEGIEGMLELKFGINGLELMNIVRAINTLDKLEDFKNLIRSADLIDELKDFLGKNV
ncbi:MAG: hypothetical protein HQK92_10380 [Nitrospirae bacterium]|nr:hypothetical protein [Nitrospirota bacterium]